MATNPSSAEFPTQIVWMPAGTHALSAQTVDGAGFVGNIICDAQAARVIAASFESIKQSGQRVWLDFNHDDGAAAAWVNAFSWNPTKGILAQVEWTPPGEDALRNKEYRSFSPGFMADRMTGRVEGLIAGRAAGGLVNAPAFGSAMPALITARLGGTSEHAGRLMAKADHSIFSGEPAGIKTDWKF